MPVRHHWQPGDLRMETHSFASPLHSGFALFRYNYNNMYMLQVQWLSVVDDQTSQNGTVPGYDPAAVAAPVTRSGVHLPE